MFELEILLANVVAPASVFLFAVLACRLLPPTLRRQVFPGVLTIAGSLAIWLAFGLRNGFALWPEDAWQKIPLVATIIACVASATELLRTPPTGTPPSGPQPEMQSRQSKRWLLELTQLTLVAIAIGLATGRIFPRGESWAELQSQLYLWWIATTLAVSLAWWGVGGCQPRVASAVGLSMIPLLIASAFLTSLSFIKVTEPLMAVATVLGLCSLTDLWLTGRRALPILIAPLIFCVAAIIAHGNFYNTPDMPRPLYFLAMLSPATIALAARIWQRKSARVAIGVTIGLGLFLALAIGCWAYFAGDVGSAEDW